MNFELRYTNYESGITISLLRYLAVSLFLFISLTGHPQQTNVEARLDTAAMLIGDHVGMTISFTGPANAEVLWPRIPDTILGHIQVIGRGKIDTSRVNAQKTLKQYLNLTCFDSGFYTIPSIPIRYRIPPDTTVLVSSSSLLTLMVHTVKVDTTQAIKPIKGPLKVPVTFREMLPWIILGISIALIIIGLIWYLKKRKKNQPVFQLRPKIKLPPHELALQELEIIKGKKLWQNGKVKEYYTEVTDVLRIYIEARFLVPAMEQTSAEILQSLIENQELSRNTWEKLRFLLELADMVKFAKTQPLPVDNENSFETAIAFIMETGTMRNEELGIKN